ncbi:GDSL-type esterase/lipase family protein [Apibacter sp. HY039]|uniref:GDSL-type esterase/lipase family protein n=1 Tax=Apibacter sp. HY039 TaxID=2501476 RepID=UPI000FEBECC4|nr:GDSL-type esterase/lipase family protein [Apibacter sp. HY039]
MKKQNLNKSALILLVLCICFFQKAYTQQNYPFIKKEKNVIHNAKVLDSFFNSLRNSKNKQVNIVHIGDSHLQANHISHVLRTNFQTLFGNAGRGLVVPYQVAGTNSPEDIKSSSQFVWAGKRNCKPLLPQPTGIGGITIETKDSISAFMLELPEKYKFTHLDIFFENDEHSFDLKIEDTLNHQSISVKNFITLKDKNISKINLSKPTNKIEFVSIKSLPIQNHMTILGINTRNDNPGVIYHSIGVNGAEYFHYDTSEYFNEQTPFLSPDLLIISLGTNEAYRKDNDFNEDIIKEEIQHFIDNLKKHNPGVPILITTPANAYVNKKYQNARLKIIHDILVSYSDEQQLAYWDLQEVSGNASNWKNYNLFSKDLIHYNIKGYQLQGNLLFNALINSFNEYVSNNP